MEIQELFYIVATIALILLSLFLVGLAYLGYRLQKFIRFSTNRIDFLSRNLNEYLVGATKTWGRFTIASFAVRALKVLFRK